MPPHTSRTRRYPWVRLWTAPGGNIDEGFFPDSPSLIPARPTDGVALSELVEDPCLVLVGEPGLGKSHAIADAAFELRHAGHAVHVVDLGAYEDGPSVVGAIVDSS